MTSKLNIFNSLPQHASDSEEETNTKNAKTKVRHEKQDARKHDNEKGGHSKHTAPRDPNQKEDVTRAKNQHKTKGVTSEPHPNDRHSGTGQSAYGGKPKRGGAGKGNVGTYKEDRKAEEGEEVEENEEVVEEKPEGRTLAEYFAERRGGDNKPQVNEAKSKITSEQLMKEVGKATLLKTRAQQEIDDKKVGKKKGTLDVDHHAGLNSEHADLLNFRTGFVEKEYKERVRGEEGAQPRRFGGPREKAPRENKEEAAPQAEGEAQAQPQGEAAPVEGQAAEGTKPEGQKDEGQNRRRNEGQRGGRGGYNKGGERRPYQGNKPSAKQVNVEDESAFPKLG